jgi:hypothetical protein
MNDLPAISDPGPHWGVAEAEYDGSPLIVRFNETAKEWVAHPEMPIKLGFAIPLNRPNETGLPHPDENKQLGQIEDVIVREVEDKARGIQVLVLSTGTMKEFVFYIVAGADIKTIHKAVQSHVSTHDVQCIADHEPAWDSYTAFAPD